MNLNGSYMDAQSTPSHHNYKGGMAMMSQNISPDMMMKNKMMRDDLNASKGSMYDQAVDILTKTIDPERGSP